MRNLKGLEPISLMGVITGALLGTLETNGTPIMFVITCVIGLLARLILDILLEKRGV